MAAIRRGGADDLAEIAVLQAACAEAAQWDAAGYAAYDLWVAEHEGRLAGFLAGRSLGAGEAELLNLAVLPRYRRQGIARALVSVFIATAGTIFLEVRESNQAAQKLYKSMGFQEISTRRGYYEFPTESAIVMKFHSC